MAAVTASTASTAVPTDPRATLALWGALVASGCAHGSPPAATEGPVAAVVDMFDAMFRGAVNGGNRVMAAGEALAHLAWLEASGELESHLDEQGVRWFQRR